MNNTIDYKGCIGSIEFSETDSIFYGKVQGIRSLISYEGTTISELINDFHRAVDDYLDLIETLKLTSVPGMKEKLVEGLNASLSETIPEENFTR